MDLADRFRALPPRSRCLLLDLEAHGEKFDICFYSKSALQDLRFRQIIEAKLLRLTPEGQVLLANVWKAFPPRWAEILKGRVAELQAIRETPPPFTMKDKEAAFTRRMKTVAKISILRFVGGDYHGQRKRWKNDSPDLDQDVKELGKAAKWALCVLAGQPNFEAPLAYLQKSRGWKASWQDLDACGLVIMTPTGNVKLTEMGEEIINVSCGDYDEDVDSEEDGEEEG